MKYHLEVLSSCDNEFFCLAGVLEQNFDFKLAEKEGLEYPE